MPSLLLLGLLVKKELEREKTDRWVARELRAQSSRHRQRLETDRRGWEMNVCDWKGYVSKPLHVREEKDTDWNGEL